MGSELTYILPQWIYRIKMNILNSTIDSIGDSNKNYIKDLDGEELWKALCSISSTVASRDKFWKEAEEEYMHEIGNNEWEHLKAEEARDCLPLGLKTEICMCGFVEDWIQEPEDNTKEKSGFFYLRTASDAHPDIKVLADDLKKQFIEQDLYKLK